MGVEYVNERTRHRSGSSSPPSKDVNERTGYCSGSSSPTNKVKFLCSHGGKILPRAADGSLKYVGGETRVIAVPRDITFSEFMKKLSALTDGEMVLKYQLVTEDLDALVSVRTDEDLKLMFSEYDRIGGGGTSMLRTFLFPSRLVVLENLPPVLDPHLLEQRYIDAINSIVRVSNMGRFSPTRAFSGSPACSTPKSYSISPAYSTPKSTSPDDHTDCLMAHDMISFNGSRSTQDPMHEVQSFPNICSLNSPNHSNAPNHSANHSNGYSGLNPNHSLNQSIAPNHSNGHSGLNMQPHDYSGLNMQPHDYSGLNPNPSNNQSIAPNHSSGHSGFNMQPYDYSSLNPNHSQDQSIAPIHNNGRCGLNMQPYDHSFYNQNYHQHHPHGYPGYPSYRMAQEPPMAAGPGKPPLNSSPGRADISLSSSLGRTDIPLSFSPGRADISRGNGFNPYHPTSRRPRGTGGYSMHADECSGYELKAGAASVPVSPRKRVAMD